ncbi:hypothetical protein BKA59DRAFT_518153 [Fusarium tricinctum]|uniref:NACHT domain-containing protein n=1 Tax=Fusarium tricinctum TaxID=61284 RepID=A0A8K0W7M4_9HYPO|nr:hypothetical protein BKA59DRAFT_518153 [Fusarium tricinctum]
MSWFRSVVWAPLKLVLLVLEKRDRGFERLGSYLTALVDALPRYNIYGEYFRNNTILQRALGNVYVSYIDFCLRAARYWESDGLVSSFKSISTSFDQQFHDIFVTINRSRDEIEKTVAAVSLLYVQGVKHITTELRETGIVQWRSEQRTKTLKWLSPIEIEQDNTTISKQWVQGTSEWILQTTKYTQWFEGQSEHEPLQILWLRGGVGSGKTFLAHFIAQTLASTNCNVLQYYFSAKQELGIRRTQMSFIRTILYQALVNTSLDTTSTLEALNRIRKISEKSEAQSPKKLWNELFRLVQGQAHPDIPRY